MSSDPSRTNFDLLRLLAVGIVVIGNGMVLAGPSPPGLWGAPLPRIGLDLLFAISGYLAAERLARSGSLASFMLGRARRVFPALAVSVLVTVFVIGPLATTLPLRAYFLAGLTRRYLYNIVLLPHPFLPGAFDGQQWSGATNPMLWTLAAYLPCCAAVALLGRMAPHRRARAALASAALCALTALVWPAAFPHLPRMLARPEFADALPELPFLFVAAALSFAGQRRSAGLWRADLAMLCFAATWVTATWVGYWTIALLWITLPYMAVCFGRMSLPGSGTFAHMGNPSYGIYLYAFPLQQLVVERMPGFAHPILACLVSATILGLLSWHAVERPALRWRRPMPTLASRRIVS